LGGILTTAATWVGTMLPSSGQLYYRTFSSSGRELWAVDLRNNINVLILQRLPDEANLSFAPDGSLILYTTGFSGVSEPAAYLINNDGSNWRALPSEIVLYATSMQTQWLSDNRHIAFLTRNLEHLTIHLVNLDDFSEEQYGIDWTDPCFSIDDISPNGRYIALQSPTVNAGVESCAGVSIMEVDGSHRNNYSGDNPPNIFDDIVWSPDSQQAMVSSSFLLSLIPDVTDDFIQPLHEGMLGPRLLVWSPDSSRILVQTNEGLYTVQTSPTLSLFQIPVTYSGQGYMAAPIWSPDSSQIAFMLALQDTSEVYAVNIDGTNLRRITFNDRRELRLWWLP
jgi:Tol biopolymer transport system component